MKTLTTILVTIAAAIVLVAGLATGHGMLGQAAGNSFGAGQGMMAMHNEVEEALESGDYQAFLILHEEYGMPMRITEEQFLQMAEWHEAMENGDTGALQQMREEGFRPGFGMRNGQVLGGNGFRNQGNGFGGCPMMG